MIMQLDKPEIHPSDIQAVCMALRENEISTSGKYVDVFNERMTEHFGRPTVGTNSGTSALFLALKAAHIGKGDTVALSACTFRATYNAVKYTGAHCEIVDVDRSTWNLDESQIPSYARAVIPVHLYGNPCILRNPSVRWVIEDACEALGSRYVSQGDFACYSYNGNKIVTGGAGGAVVCKEQYHADLISSWIKPGHYYGVGYNFGMPSLISALVLSQFERLTTQVAAKRAIHKVYRAELDDLVWFQEETPGTLSNRWYTAILVEDRELVESHLNEQGIPTRRIFTPLADLPVATYLYEHGICLPSSVQNRYADIKRVCDEIRRCL